MKEPHAHVVRVPYDSKVGSSANHLIGCPRKIKHITKIRFGNFKGFQISRPKLNGKPIIKEPFPQ